MPYWLITLDGKSGKLLHGGPYASETQAQRAADNQVTNSRYDIVQTRSRDWSRASQEVKAALADKHSDISYGASRIYDSKPGNKIEEEVEKPTVYRKKRVGKGLLNRRKPRRVSSSEPRSERRVRIR